MITEEVAGVESKFTQISQEAEDYIRIWVGVYEVVMDKTRDTAQACYEAKHAWNHFRKSLEKIEAKEPLSLLDAVKGLG
jgi:hypothetical protein